MTVALSGIDVSSPAMYSTVLKTNFSSMFSVDDPTAEVLDSETVVVTTRNDVIRESTVLYTIVGTVIENVTVGQLLTATARFYFDLTTNSSDGSENRQYVLETTSEPPSTVAFIESQSTVANSLPLKPERKEAAVGEDLRLVVNVTVWDRLRANLSLDLSAVLQSDFNYTVNDLVDIHRVSVSGPYFLTDDRKITNGDGVVSVQLGFWNITEVDKADQYVVVVTVNLNVLNKPYCKNDATVAMNATSRLGDASSQVKEFKGNYTFAFIFLFRMKSF